MATIYLHPTGGGTGDNCLILDPKERLIYPFNIGNYSEARFGMIYSFAPVTGSNGEVSAESFPTVSASQAVYIGLCNYNTGTSNFPGQSNGYDFLGISTRNPATNAVLFQVSSNIQYYGGGDSNYWMFLPTCQTGFLDYRNQQTFDNQSYQYLQITPTSGVYGQTKFSSAFGIQLVLNSNTFAFRAFFNNSSSNDTSNNYLRTGVNSMWTLGNVTKTGFFTSGYNNTSDIMMKPNAIYIYNPLLQNRLRIHNILVERYA